MIDEAALARTAWRKESWSSTATVCPKNTFCVAVPGKRRRRCICSEAHPAQHLGGFQKGALGNRDLLWLPEVPNGFIDPGSLALPVVGNTDWSPSPLHLGGPVISDVPGLDSGLLAIEAIANVRESPSSLVRFWQARVSGFHRGTPSLVNPESCPESCPASSPSQHRHSIAEMCEARK